MKCHKLWLLFLRELTYLRGSLESTKMFSTVYQTASFYTHLYESINKLSTLFQTTNFRFFQTSKEFADDNFKFEENG